MAISIEKTTEEKSQIKSPKPFVLIFVFWILIVIVTIGAIIYFLFLKKPAEEEIAAYKPGSEVLTKEELEEFQEMSEEIKKNSFDRLKQEVPAVLKSPPPQKNIGQQLNIFK